MSSSQQVPTIVEYYKYLTGYSLPIPLEKFLNDMDLSDPKNFANKHILLFTGNNCSKTLGLSVQVMWYMKVLPKIVGRPITVLFITAQSKKLLGYLRDFGREHQELVEDLVHHAGIFEMPDRGFFFKDGSGIIIRTATSRMVAGEKGDIVICDEVGLIKDHIVKDVWNHVNGKGIDRIILVGTQVRNSLFNEYIQNVSSNLWKVYHWNQYDCPWNLDKIESQKLVQGESSPEFISSVLGEIPNVLSEFIFREEIKKCIKTGPMFLENGETIAGMDLSRGARDKNALVIFEKIGKKLKMVYAKRYEGKDGALTIQQCIDEVNRALADFKVTLTYVDSQPQTTCLYVQQTLITPYKIMNPEEFHLKGRLVQNLRRMMNSGQIEISEQFEDLISEFRDYHPEKCHRVDLCDAAMLAAFSKQDEAKDGDTVFIKIHREDKEEDKIYLSSRDKRLHELGEL
jgi:hypothetical protein